MFKEAFVLMLQRMLGIVFLVLGIIGLLVPFLQGILFIFIGLALLGSSQAKQKVRVVVAWIKMKLH